MQKEYVIQFFKTINKLLCNLSFAGQYTTGDGNHIFTIEHISQTLKFLLII